MDKEKILEQHGFIPEKRSKFKENETFFEVMALIIVAVSIFYLGTVMLLNKKSDNNINNKPNITESAIQNNDKESTTTNAKEQSNNEQDNTTTQPVKEELRLTITNPIGAITYSKDHEVGSKVILKNVAANTYFLKDITDRTLFTTQTSQNEVTCIIAKPIENTKCTVVETPPTTTIAPATGGTN